MPSNTRTPIQVANFSPNMKIIGNMFAFDMETPTHWLLLPEPPNVR